MERDERQEAVPRGQRELIVNADDFGRGSGVNQGVITAFEQGIVTSASLMVRHPAAEEAAAYARAHPELGMGLHIDLGEWVYRDDEWALAYQVVPEDDAEAVEAEITRQLDRFLQLVGRPPTHLDSHQHVHRTQPIRPLVLSLGSRLDVPVRHFSSAMHYCGKFYGQTATGVPYPQGITLEALRGLIDELQLGTTELVCHPATEVCFETMYREERVRELAVLCDPSLRPLLRREKIRLRTFAPTA